MPLYGKAPNSVSDVKEYRIPGLSLDLINSNSKINPQTSVKTAGKKIFLISYAYFANNT